MWYVSMIEEGGHHMRCALFEADTPCVSLEYRCIMIIRNFLPFVVFHNGLSIHMAMDSSGLLAGKGFKGFDCVLFA